MGLSLGTIPTVTHKPKKRLVIPIEGAVFPARCVRTAKTDDLVWVEVDLDLLANPSFLKKTTPFVKSPGPPPRLRPGTCVQQVSWRPRQVPEPRRRSASLHTNPSFFAKWQKSNRRLKWGLRACLILGLIGVFGGLAGLLAFDRVSPEYAETLGLVSIVSGILLVVTGIVAVAFSQPLVHDVAFEAGGKHVSVRGASPQFLERLERFRDW